MGKSVFKYSPEIKENFLKQIDDDARVVENSRLKKIDTYEQNAGNDVVNIG